MLRPTWFPFSIYADQFEKQIDKLLRKAAFLGPLEAQRRVTELMQTNLVILNLWLESKFKGYKYLTRGARKQMYANAEKTGQFFLNYTHQFTIKDQAIADNLKSLGLTVPSAPGDAERLRYLVMMMNFLSPRGDKYEYLEGASFGKLLTDSSKGQKMIGDCNQIVTFYTYLYSLRYELKDLQIKILPGHVCLHYKGIDIEATAGQFANYKDYLQILPISELISTNLLDVSDFRDKQIQISPREFLKGAQLAFNLSSQKEIVAKNLKSAYHNVAVEVLKKNDFENAVFFLEKSGLENDEDRQFLRNIYHNAVIYNVKNKSFNKARYYASKDGQNELLKYIDEQEGFYYLEHENFSKASELFARSGNTQMVKATYGKQYNKIQARVSGLHDLATMRSHKDDYRKLLDLARKMEDAALIDNLHKILSQIS